MGTQLATLSRPAVSGRMLRPFSDSLRELEEAEAIAEEGSWTLGYLDVMLLLLTLLVVLLGITYMQLQDSLKDKPGQVAFELPAPTPAAAPARLDPRLILASLQVRPEPPAPPPAPARAPEPLVVARPSPPVAAPPVLPSPDEPPPEVQLAAAALEPELVPASPLVALAEMLTQQLGERLDLVLDERELRLELRDDILFPLGSADLGERGRGLLDGLVGMLAQRDLTVSVEGHTDDLPIASSRFPSNWELSAFRASTVARHLIDRGIAPERLRTSGFADTRPRVPNDGPEGRAQNRRVSLVLHLLPPRAPVEAAQTEVVARGRTKML